MTTVTTIAQRMLDENNYSTDDITTTNTEYLIKNAVDYTNLVAGTSITFTPSSGTASLTAEDGEIAAIKFLATLMIRAYLDRGPNTSIGSVNVTAILNDPQYALFSDLYQKAITRLRGMDFRRT